MSLIYIMGYKDIFLKIIKIGIILILFTPLILGLFGLTVSSYPKAVFFRSLVEIIFIFYVLLVFLDRKYLPKISSLILATSLFVGILILTSLTGFNFHRSFWGDLYRVEGVILYIHLLVFLLILISVFQRKKEWLKLFRITVIISAICSFAGILQKLGIFSFYDPGSTLRISGTWTNPDFFAPYIVLTIFIAIFLLAVEKKRNWKVVWVAILALNCFTLILSGTRAAWIGFGAGLIFLFSFWLFGCSNLNHKKREAILSGILILSILFLGVVLNSDRLSLTENLYFQRMISMFDWESGSVQSRLINWEITLDGWKDKPVLGWGPESFGFVFDKYFKADYIEELSEDVFYDRPHNKVLELTATTGILGILGYLFIFFTVFYLLFKSYKRAIAGSKENFRPILSLILIAFFISYFIQNLFCFDTIGNNLIFFLVIGFVSNNFLFSRNKKSLITENLSGEKKAFFHRRNFRIVLTIFFISLSLITFYQLNFKPTTASRILVRGAIPGKEGFSKTLSEYKKALSQNTIFDKDLRRKVTGVLIYVLEKHKIPKNTEREIIEFLSDLKPFLEKDLEEPDIGYLGSHELLARVNERIYLLSKDPEALKDMEKVVMRAISFNEQSPKFYRLLGKIKIFQGKYSEGEALFQKAYRLTPEKLEDEINLYEYLGVAYFRAGNKQKAAENFKKALDRKFCLERFNPMPSQETLAFAQKVARIYCRDLNDLETCRQIYEKAMEIFPENQKQLQFELETFLN